LGNLPAPGTSSLIAFVITAAVVFRFAQRELRERTITARWLWVRPAVLVVLAAYLIAASAQFAPRGDTEMLAVVAGGAVLGVLVGLLIVRNSTFAAAEKPRAVRVRGNRVTLFVWIGALAVRVLARYVLPYGAEPRSQLPLDCGTVMMTAVAFVAIAVAVRREIARYAGVAP
jgi:predicted membrane-bound spermidine synthase